MQKKILLFAAISGLLAVVLGAFGAHALDQAASKLQDAESLAGARMLNAYKTAVQYQFYHTITLLFLAIWMRYNTSRLLTWASRSLIAGILLFSGSLYVMAICMITCGIHLRWLGPVTPIGGLLFIAGWALMVVAALKQKNQ
jgi:uncharacterized membrane protein YgdD (TMEM256/DUF423 family)